MAKSSKYNNNWLWIFILIVIFGFIGIAIGGGLLAANKSGYKSIDDKEKYCSNC